jgi:quercetin dioxygenase-like cupin family protein
MSGNTPSGTRRTLLKGIVGIGAASAALSMRETGGGLLSLAQAQSFTGVRAGQGGLLHISGASAPTTRMAEWADANAAATGRHHIASTAAALAKAPEHAAHYEAKLHSYPSGSLRVLTFKRGSPVHHQITFESQIYILKGSATLRPLEGLSGKPVTVKEGDALFLPSGILTSPKAEQDFVILQMFVGYRATAPKQAIVTAREAESYRTAQWQKDGKEFSTRVPAEIRAAPKDAAVWSTKRYRFDGNSIRVASFRKGGRTNLVTITGSDVLIYIAKGRFRRHEGNEVFDLVEGDTTREVDGNPGYWEVLEDSVFIATDAPLTPAAPTSGWTAELNRNASEGTKLFEMGIDHNNRSVIGLLDIPMKKVSDLESISAKQDALHFRIGLRPFFPRARTHPDYESAGGPFEMHVGGPPHFVARMSGSTENTMQDGSVLRQTAGDFVYVRPGSLHHSNQVGHVPGVVLNLVMPGTDLDTQPLVIK